MPNYNYRFFNGVNHDVNLYSSESDYALNRRGQYFITNPTATPTITIKQNRPLSAGSNLLSFQPTSRMKVFLPEVLSVQLEGLTNFADYDVVIVSGIYAELARQALGNQPDYLDRLFVPISLYDTNPQFCNGKPHVIGAVGLRKAWWPKTPWEYVSSLRIGQLPSVAAMETCLEIYRVHRPYCDANTATLLQEMEIHLPERTKYLRLAM